MESRNLQFAMASLVASLFVLALAVGIGMARLHPMPLMDVSVNGTLIAIGLFAAPLLWWRIKTGYVVCIVFGLINVVGDLYGLIMGLPDGTRIPGAFYPPIIMLTIFSALLVYYAWRLMKEKR